MIGLERRDDVPVPKMERDEMAGQDLEYYMEHSEQFEALSEDDKARLIAGESLKGDTEATPAVAEENSEPPAAVTEPAVEATETENEPALLAKDGKHTIPYQELLDARESAKQWEQAARETAEQLAGLKQAEPTPPAAAAASPAVAVDLAALIKQGNEALMEGDLDKANEVQAAIQAETQRRATEDAHARIKGEFAAEKQQTAAETAQSLFDAQVTKSLAEHPFLDSSSGEANPDAIDLVVAKRDKLIAEGFAPHEALAEAVGKVAPLFQKPAPAVTTQEPVNEVARKAAEAIAKAKTKVPTSLSDVPAGSAAHHDEAEAMRNMSSVGLMNKFAGKTPDQIMALMSRVI